MRSFLTGSHQLPYVPQGDIHGHLVYDAIREGLYPFKPRTINLYMEYDIDFWRYVFFAEVWFPDRQLRCRADIYVPDLETDLMAGARRIANEMFRGFRYRQTYPIPDHIVLGEN
jgi:hypothetical protein